MQPSTLLRAALPLRTSSLSIFRSTRSHILSGSSLRAASTTTTAQPPPQQRQSQPPPTSITSTATPPSLRKYPYTIRSGTVTSVGLMDRTVRVAHRHTTYDPHIRKTYAKVTTYLVSDPRNSLREGDVIEFSSGAPKSRRVRHVVERIVAPFGVGVEERPAVMSREEREAERARKRIEKIQRREARRMESGQGEGVKDHVGRIKSLVMERVGEEEKVAQSA